MAHDRLPFIVIPQENNISSSFLIDTGASPCLIKASHVEKENINHNNKITIKGISGSPFTTIGTTIIKILNTDTLCHIIPDSTDLIEDGLLGSEFFNKNKAEINYEKKYLKVGDKYCSFGEIYSIEPRCEQILHLPVSETNEKDGYIHTLDLGEGVYGRSCLVHANNGKAYLKIFNTTEEKVKIICPELELEEFEV